MTAASQYIDDVLTHEWKHLLWRGIAAILFAVVTWLRPGITLAAVVWTFAFFALVDGLLACAAAVAERKHRPQWWIAFFGGILGIVIAIVAITMPGAVAVSLLYLIAAWALMRGVFQVIAAIRLRREVSGEWRLMVMGVISILFGIAIVARPAVGILSLLWLVGAYALITGILFIMLAFRVRHIGARVAQVGDVIGERRNHSPG